MHIGKKDRDGKPYERTALEEQVDAMLDPKRPDEPAAPEEPAPDDSSSDGPAKVSAVSTAAETTKTAPALSDDLRKKIGVSDADTKPLSIDRLDEITGKVSDSDTKDEPKHKKTEEPEAPDDGPASTGDLDDGATDLDDARTEEAVEDILSHEGDVVLAVEDATRAQHNRQSAESGAKRKKGGHHILATIMWTLVAFVAVVALMFLVLLVTGGDVTAK
ncbi:MAG TPA: hypothetical protein VFX84_00920 [Candidatus Saccharimonadales bacterium]|nr:hypothetical protein [Candidatus Saccharimonadales bacterium]